jgi:hypothetical protein
MAIPGSFLRIKEVAEGNLDVVEQSLSPTGRQLNHFCSIQGITAIHAKIHAKVFYQLSLWQTYGYILLFDFKE